MVVGVVAQPIVVGNVDRNQLVVVVVAVVVVVQEDQFE